jgi:hypothetical protein
LVGTKCDEFEDMDTLNLRCESDFGPGNISANMDENNDLNVSKN